MPVTQDSRTAFKYRGLVSGALRFIRIFLLLVGAITVLVVITPVDYWWAHAYSGPIQQPTGDVLIVLAAADDDRGFISYSSYWRARYALLAWRSGSFKTIVITGGGPEIRDLLITEGVPASAILSEWQSSSTRDNALNTERLLQGMIGRKVLLTSDFHMFRAQRVFRKVGIDVVPYPVPDVLKRSQHWNTRISGFETLVTETAKILDYRLHGWI